jgi:hypothetical protein
MRPTVHLLCSSMMLLAAQAAVAQSTQPGLWEIQNKVGGNPQVDQAMAQMQQQMAAMSPAQRKMMEDMMARQGVGMSAGPGGAMTVKVCITPEMAAKQEMPVQAEGDCTTRVTHRTGNTLTMSFTCSNPASSGEGTYTWRSDKAYDMNMLVRSTQNGKPVSTTIKGSGRWLGADCGQIKPVPTPSKK